MKFILTSSSFVTTKEWVKHLDHEPSSLKAVFIDTAADMYDKSEAWLQGDRKALIAAGFEVSDYTLTDKTKKQLSYELAPFDLIFVSGGNTFYLLEKAQQSGFIELIQENAFPKATYVGSSAGSVLLSNDIDAIQYLDDPKEAELSSTQAIGVLNSVLLPHWGSDTFKPRYEKTFKYVYENKIPITTLSDDQFIVIDGDSFKLHTINKQTSEEK